MTRQVALAAIGSFLVTVTIFSLWSPTRAKEPAPAPAVVAPPPLPERAMLRPRKLDRPVLVDSKLGRQRQVPVAKADGPIDLPGATVLVFDAGTP